MLLKPCWGIRNEPSGPPAEANWIQTRAASRNGLDLDEGHACRRKWAGPGAEGVGCSSQEKGLRRWVLSEVTVRDRHVIIINIDRRPARWWVLLRTWRHSWFLSRDSFILVKRSTFWCSCPLYCNSAEESFTWTKETNLFLLLIPPQILYFYWKFLSSGAAALIPLLSIT